MTRRLQLPALVLLLAALALTAGGCACSCRQGVSTAPVAPAQVAAAPEPVAEPQATADDDSTTVLPTGPTPEAATLTEVRQIAPEFTVPTLAGPTFRLTEQRGKVVLVNWFATWCPPCKAEMPELKSRVWEQFAANPDFVMISVAREEDTAKVGPFVSERALPWTFGLDTDRAAFAQYAEAFIPRNHVIGRDGRIVFQSEGFHEEEFAAMVDAIAAELAR